MNIDFGRSHMETLADLMRIADKHSCVITFGIGSSPSIDLDEELLEKSGLTSELIEEMRDKKQITEVASLFDKAWFELYDKRNNTHSTLAYIESSTHFVVSRDNYSLFEEVSADLEEWLDDHDDFGRPDEYFIMVSHNPTIIHGFGNKEKIEDFRVYRSGMALKFFGDLVCDYLKEPRIVRSY